MSGRSRRWDAVTSPMPTSTPPRSVRPASSASHVGYALWVLLDLVEAAVRTGRHADAAAHVRAMRDAGLERLSPRLSLIVAGAAALAAPRDQARALFETALATPRADQWPFDLARVRLVYGEWLRRERSTTEARAQLSTAMNTFRQLGALPWQARAGSELRAAGLATLAADPGSPLSPLDRQIAELAAAGLTNKQIGERLYLSHRTVCRAPVPDLPPARHHLARRPPRRPGRPGRPSSVR